MSDEPVFCKDCKFRHQETYFFFLHRNVCKHPQSRLRLSRKKFLVLGDDSATYWECIDMRVTEEKCGKEGKLFFPIDKIGQVEYVLDGKENFEVERNK
jgi:hypothetical protein